MITNESDLFKILADENRLRMIVLLIDRELCMTHIYIGLDLKQSNTSRNLKILKEAGIVSMRNKKNNRYFKISDEILSNYNEVFTYLKTLKKKTMYICDEKRMKAVEKCGCKGTCECKL
ncbi:ArsR family transcriptional regulator [Bacilli bacterium PM5-3]|nr:ArsR family transcriptional regulator [Bacilli bacterium PM5-3]MDH6603512.1 ArsR family transcriptional regulator [Bacilli bacterium PM5-9]